MYKKSIKNKSRKMATLSGIRLFYIIILLLLLMIVLASLIYNNASSL